ncbi:MAG TPA: hydrogenase nickel incorporation protein HypB, partial [Methanosarcinales archaeon]|nr:hydrogenase nickel incorporation protein HypB [Methanosarcinales archaeon]
MHMTINIEHDVLQANKEIAIQNNNLLNKYKVTAFNIMGAIGSGKTTLIELAIQKLSKKYKIGVIAGDIVARIDASRFEALGVPTIGMNTGKECHLDALMVEHALKKLPLRDLDLLFIENVGNLICPVDYILGEHKRVVMVSVSEGDDIVNKHHKIFKESDLAIINKIDIAEAVGVDADKMMQDAQR